MPTVSSYSSNAQEAIRKSSQGDAILGGICRALGADADCDMGFVGYSSRHRTAYADRQSSLWHSGRYWVQKYSVEGARLFYILWRKLFENLKEMSKVVLPVCC